MRFSIIIPVYNAEKYIRHCVDSIICQSYADFEVVCVDDGSTDASRSLLNEYSVTDRRIRIFSQTNSGVAAARNFALEKASGDWVWFVDSDDMIHPDALSWFNQIVEALPDVDTISTTEFLSGTEEPDIWPKISSLENVRLKDSVDGELLKAHRRVVCGTLIRRSVIGETRFGPYVMGEDMLFLSEIFWKAKKWALGAAPVYFYRKHTGSAISSRPIVRSVKDAIETETKILSLIKDHREEWKDNDLSIFFSFARQFAWETFGGMYFRLTSSDRIKLLDAWIAMQTLYQSLVKENLYRRIALKIIRSIRSATLCKLLVIGPKMMGVPL